MTEPILTVVEELKGFSMRALASRMYDPSFWLPYIPLAKKSFIQIHPKQYAFEIGDRFALDPLNTIVQDFQAKGTLSVQEGEPQGEKGSLWDLHFSIPEPQVLVQVRIRAKDLPNGIKVGIYVTQLKYDLGLLHGVGQDAILFAARVKIRDFLMNMQKMGI